jgi:hypothetical protein
LFHYTEHRVPEVSEDEVPAATKGETFPPEI